MVRRIGFAVIVLAWVSFSIIDQTDCRADIVFEDFVVDHDDFFFGMTGTGPVSATSLRNFFPTGPNNQGGVQLQGAHSLLEGSGNVRFTTAADGLTRLGIGLGNVNQSSITDASLINTEFEISEIDSDADADGFSFEFNANFLFIGAADAIGDFDIVVEGATFSTSLVNEGLFRITLQNTSVNPSSIRISGANGAVIDTITFRNISSDVVNDELLVTSSRLLFVPTAVPEPTSTTFGCLGLLVVTLRRRRSGN